VPPKPTPAALSRFGLSWIGSNGLNQRLRIPIAGCQVGRSHGNILFPEDPYTSPLHASLLVREGRLYIRDEGSVSGVLASVQQELIAAGTQFSAGNHLFRYAGAIEPTPHPAGRPVVYGAPLPQAIYLVEELLVGCRSGRAVVTSGPLLTIGSALCDLAYPSDDSLAPRHCEVTPSPTGAILRDLSGSSGTFVQLATGGERPLNPGDRFRIGEHILQVELVS